MKKGTGRDRERRGRMIEEKRGRSQGQDPDIEKRRKTEKPRIRNLEKLIKSQGAGPIPRLPETDTAGVDLTEVGGLRKDKKSGVEIAVSDPMRSRTEEAVAIGMITGEGIEAEIVIDMMGDIEDDDVLSCIKFFKSEKILYKPQ